MASGLRVKIALVLFGSLGFAHQAEHIQVRK
jgi:hypothetical protein